MLKEFEFKFKRIFDINSKYDSHCFNQIDTKLIYLRAFYNLYTFLKAKLFTNIRGFGVLGFWGLGFRV